MYASVILECVNMNRYINMADEKEKQSHLLAWSLAEGMAKHKEKPKGCCSIKETNKAKRKPHLFNLVCLNSETVFTVCLCVCGSKGCQLF